MGSETIKLPNIDFSNEDLKTGTLVWNQVKNQVHQALVNYGCFEASFDKIPIHLRKSIFESLKELFDLPLQTKIRNTSTKPFHGYVGQYPAVPLYESMGIDDANISDKAESFTRILWPEGNPNFCKTIQSYSEQLSELDQTVRRMILESLGVEKYMDEHVNSTNYLLRVMKYKGPQSNETKIGLNAHTDKNIVTILYQNQVNGLEVLTKDGHWINVEPTPDAFIVMIGDSLYAWANGRVHSPYHRVMMTGNEARYSVGLFSIPKAGYKIKAPEELVDKEHPLLFKPFDHVEFLAFYYTEEGQRCGSALKTYCGV
ncbi:PREDICTED: probable 2-oxoglutarate-dependent dioxygenase AOP1 [Nicotiana attenuata]|uniref:2-oxoglutarate-dependent dioxygenase aop1.2 n=1 Tax=Nicotiana attenuata TaxID=49451 RepID=A0A1J6IQA4_NICAT|nr:PREDICTED: probable 2-oxoglutarate-dependent dioxygenase AOP1 [Nicotiana attenuata]OIT02752.1 putative 2-oxoglutarate-dependent dioxygenase aop1.2 [Nicotiana attenuata]